MTIPFADGEIQKEIDRVIGPHENVGDGCGQKAGVAGKSVAA